MKATSLLKVKQSQIVKISLLVSVLLSLPKTIFIYRMIGRGKMDFSDFSFSEFALQFVFLFLFSWLILQLSANWSYRLIKNPTWRLVITILIGAIVLFILLNVLSYMYASFTGASISREEMGFLHFNYFVILTVLLFVARILRLQIIQRENIRENEQLKQQSLQNELTALKNQIDPHFLFNSLNSLNSLIRNNKEATTFVTKLSFMYRYILQSGDQDLVSVSEELKFLQSYVHLIKTRYRDRFTIEIAIDNKHLEKFLPPLALQSLVENAVKHNEISQSHPLKVKVFSQEDSVYVENPIRPRTTLAEGTKNGLANLKKRYLLLGKQKMTVSTENQTFQVQLPFIQTP
jgi:sensor histidine kinase YesM